LVADLFRGDYRRSWEPCCSTARIFSCKWESTNYEERFTARLEPYRKLKNSLGGRTLDDDFNVLQDTDTFGALLDSICDDLQSTMRSDWEKKLREIEANDIESNE
jgi:hypothetical protein